MKVLNLRCEHDHAFEGWFGSDEDFETQCAQALVACPLCGSTSIAKGLSAPRLNLGAGRGPEASTPAPAAAAGGDDAQGPQARWLRAVREVMARTEDVGERFAEEARRMHYGEAEERGIRGQATAEQAEALLDEGIAVMPLPLPPGLKSTLQ